LVVAALKARAADGIAVTAAFIAFVFPATAPVSLAAAAIFTTRIFTTRIFIAVSAIFIAAAHRESAAIAAEVTRIFFGLRLAGVAKHPFRSFTVGTAILLFGATAIVSGTTVIITIVST
jgi:hypothetical protein